MNIIYTHIKADMLVVDVKQEVQVIRISDKSTTIFFLLFAILFILMYLYQFSILSEYRELFDLPLS